MKDSERCKSMTAQHDGAFLDYSRQCATKATMNMLFDLAKAAKLQEKLAQMGGGAKLNTTEDRAVLHVALRAPKTSKIMVDGNDVVKDVHAVLDRVKKFTAEIRSGARLGASGKRLTNVVAIGIGGSYLGPEFVYEALRTDSAASKHAKGRVLRFLANVDPVDVARALDDLDPESTLVVVVSKSFTTAETMLNARTVRSWLLSHYKGIQKRDAPGTSDVSPSESDVVSRHVIALSANVPLACKFGVSAENVFGFWDWVGGRYSVCSVVGMMPLSLQYGFDTMAKFLEGAHSVDKHVFSAPVERNIPVLLGLLGVWNSSFLGHKARALLPYAQALLRFPAHIQQVDMESNGKRVTLDGTPLPFSAGEIDFGEPGTNGQHSFYQLIHQGTVVPCDFIGFCKSQQPIELAGEAVSNHDELMSNFFAQPDALACGKTIAELAAEGVPANLRPHKSFPGNRPSSSLLFERLDAYTAGQLLSIYEHRTAVQGFIWGINSFDQWGVQLGKVLAKKVRRALSSSSSSPSSSSSSSDAFNPSTSAMLAMYKKMRG